MVTYLKYHLQRLQTQDKCWSFIIAIQEAVQRTLKGNLAVFKYAPTIRRLRKWLSTQENQRKNYFEYVLQFHENITQFVFNSFGWLY